jgi:hypothetical protein
VGCGGGHTYKGANTKRRSLKEQEEEGENKSKCKELKVEQAQESKPKGSRTNLYL